MLLSLSIYIYIYIVFSLSLYIYIYILLFVETSRLPQPLRQNTSRCWGIAAELLRTAFCCLINSMCLHCSLSISCCHIFLMLYLYVCIYIYIYMFWSFCARSGSAGAPLCVRGASSSKLRLLDSTIMGNSLRT